ncbi:uncharacterized protein LOC117169854 [Belonocnema kinseyi]|uniref:uncharacterized protein LOC117169854 n=1 Tax=Belonocnema kinseyi TaxID=2817044 RepID=UPI00143CCC7F|nr:uncharacterized protein LOC117169854 [Belonocnema kinseyi]
MIPPLTSLENQECERAFADGHRRDSSGRYIVRLSLRPSCIHTLGESLQGAKRIHNTIRVDDRDVDIQRIVWRKPGANEHSHYQLRTLIYGMLCTSFLGIRTLQQLATDEANSYSAASELIRKNIYVDDILSGATDEVSAIELRDQLIQLLKYGGMHLRKWFQTDGLVNALIVAWDPVSDEFRFKAPVIDSKSPITNRKVLADISRLVDPVGWLSPITIVAKILMQDLWKAHVGWDTSLPKDLLERWKTFQKNLPEMTAIHCLRWIGYHPEDRKEIHSFGDASKYAFAATVYVQVHSSHGACNVQLITSKTQVAPVKTISIPKLELCAAVLVARLINYVREELKLSHAVTYAWSDSRNVLSGIQTDDPSRWPIYVANRVSEIQRTLSNAVWRYVTTKVTSANIAPRGVDPRALAQKSLWWNGPRWLSQKEASWPAFHCLDESPSTDSAQDNYMELKQPTIAVRHVHCNLTTIGNFSSLTHLTQVIARCLLFKLLLKPAIERSELMVQRFIPEEIHRAFLACVFCAQGCSFEDELSTFRQRKALKKRNKLVRLHPFIDSTGIFRVTGQVAKSPLPYDQRHPVILHGDSSLAGLIIDWGHRTALHGGFQLTYSCAVRRAWIIRGRVSVKAHI